MPVSALIKQDNLIAGATVQDLESAGAYILARVVVNAQVCSPIQYADDEPEAKASSPPSQGSPRGSFQSFLPGTSAIMVPHTPDGRCCLQCLGMTCGCRHNRYTR